VKILALDFGTKTGVAHNLRNPDDLTAETYELATKREITLWGKQRLTRRCDPRPERLGKILGDIADGLGAPDVVVFEDVEFTTYTWQCQLWSSLRTAAWLSLSERAKHFDCINVTSLKLFATRCGGATKEMMKSALTRRYPAFANSALDDNAIDAIWIWLWAKQNLSRIPL
jgi:hypothetical protein